MLHTAVISDLISCSILSYNISLERDIMASEKTVNYTAEQTAELVQHYLTGTSVDKLAEMLGKSVASVTAKLVREGVYVAKSKAKAEGGRTTKGTLIKELAGMLNGVTYEQLETLEKASRDALVLLVAEFRGMKEVMEDATMASA